MGRLVRYAIQWTLLGLALATAIGIAAAIGTPAAPPIAQEEADVGPLVRAMKVARGPFGPPVVGYGTARAPRIYAVRCEVTAKVLEVSDSFVPGKKVEKGDVLFRLDTRVTELSISETEARIREVEAGITKVDVDVRPIDAEVARLERDLESARAVLEKRQQAVDLARQEYDRVKRLVDRGASSKSELESSQQRLNQEEQNLLDAQNRVAAIPADMDAARARKEAVLAQKTVSEAQIEVLRSTIEQLRLTLSRTAVKSPVRGLVLDREPATGESAKRLARDDVLQAGQSVGWLLPLDEGIEIPVPIEVTSAFWIRGMRSLEDQGFDFDSFTARIPPVQVEWFPDGIFKWTGRVDRFLGEIDVATRMTTLVVMVDQPGEQMVPGEKGPLVPGMYCRIEIPGEVLEDALAIPRSALREGNRVFVARDGRLEIREIKPLRLTEDSVAVAGGIEAGELLVLSDLPQAIPGMRVRTEVEAGR